MMGYFSELEVERMDWTEDDIDYMVQRDADIIDEEVIDNLRFSRLKAIRGKYVIVADARTGKGAIRFLQDQKLCSKFRKHYWTQYLSNAKGYDDIEDAKHRIQNLKYNNPRIMMVGMNYRLMNTSG